MLLVTALGTPGSAAVAYLTDIEGGLAKFRDFTVRHPAFEIGSDSLCHVKPGWVFVHGGDVCDRFPGEMAFMRELLRLKAEAPEQVVLIAGNRDINKLRLPLELTPEALAQPPARHPREWHTWLQAGGHPDTRENRLKWMLERTMGAPKAFELRRRELAHEQNRDPSQVTDVEVTDSYLETARPNGLFHRILQKSEPGRRLGNTLFLHAGLPPGALGRVPGAAGKTGRPARLDQWLIELNRWYNNSLSAWEAVINGGDSQRLAEARELISYAEPAFPSPMNPRSVVYGRTIDAEGKVCFPPPRILEWLRQQGISRLVVGHTPSGDLPTIERTADGTFELIVGDTSYCPRSDEAPLITFDGPQLEHTVIAGAIAFEQNRPCPVSYTITLGTPAVIGRRLEDSGLLIAPCEDAYIRYRLKPGYQVEYRRQVFP